MESGSEYHTGSEFAPDFNSDNEPPVDKENEKKLFHKTTDLRIYKRILRVPKRSFELPAKFDRVDVKFMESDSELLSFAGLAEMPVTQWQLGFSKITKSVEVAITSMKRGEIAIFEDEKVTLDRDTKERKLVGKSYFMLELMDFVTIIDLFGDNTTYKIQLEKGTGIDRLAICDKVRMELGLINSQRQLVWQRKDTGQLLELGQLVDHVFETMPFDHLANFKKQTTEILLTMKDKEESYIEFPDPSFAEPPSPSEELTPNTEALLATEVSGVRELTGTELVKVREISIPTYKGRLYLHVHVLENARIDDVFSDNTVLKKTLKTGISTACPELLSLVYFDYKIEVDGETILSSDLNSFRK